MPARPLLQGALCKLASKHVWPSSANQQLTDKKYPPPSCNGWRSPRRVTALRRPLRRADVRGAVRPVIYTSDTRQPTNQEHVGRHQPHMELRRIPRTLSATRKAGETRHRHAVLQKWATSQTAKVIKGCGPRAEMSKWGPRRVPDIVIVSQRGSGGQAATVRVGHSHRKSTPDHTITPVCLLYYLWLLSPHRPLVAGGRLLPLCLLTGWRRS